MDFTGSTGLHMASPAVLPSRPTRSNNWADSALLTIRFTVAFPNQHTTARSAGSLAIAEGISSAPFRFGTKTTQPCSSHITTYIPSDQCEENPYHTGKHCMQMKTNLKQQARVNYSKVQCASGHTSYPLDGNRIGPTCDLVTIAGSQLHPILRCKHDHTNTCMPKYSAGIPVQRSRSTVMVLIYVILFYQFLLLRNVCVFSLWKLFPDPSSRLPMNLHNCTQNPRTYISVQRVHIVIRLLIKHMPRSFQMDVRCANPEP